MNLVVLGKSTVTNGSGVERLHRCDQSARAQINQRITRLLEQTELRGRGSKERMPAQPSY
jgi:hypothetical protein